MSVCIRNAWRELLEKKVFSLILVLALALGLCFPVLTFSEAEYFVRTHATMHYRQEEHMVAADFFAPASDEKEILRMLAGAKGACKTAFFSWWGTIASAHDKNTTVLVSGIGGDFFEVGNIWVTAGRRFTEAELQNGEAVCMIAVDRAQRDGLSVGDSLTIQNTVYKVVGLYADAKGNDMLMPYRAVEKQKSGERIQYRALVMFEAEPDTAAVEAALRSGGAAQVTLLEIQPASQATAAYEESFWQIFGGRLAVGILALLFAVVCVGMLLYGTLLDAQATLGVKLAAGATKGRLIQEQLVKNLFLTLCAIGLNWLAFPLLRWGLGFSAGQQFGPVTFAFAFLLGMIFVALVTAVACRGLMRKTIAELVKK